MKIIIAIGTILLFWANAAAAQDQYFTIGKKQPVVEPAKKASDPKPTWHAETETFSCPDGYRVYADEKEAGAGKLFVHCMKDKSGPQAQVETSTPQAKAVTPVKSMLSDNLTYEEAVAYIQAASANGQNGTDSTPDAIGKKKNLNASFARAASKALLSLSIGQPKDADPWIGAARNLADPGAGGVPEIAALLVLMNIEREIYDRNLLGKRFDKEECIQGMYVQLHQRHFWSTPIACKK